MIDDNICDNVVVVFDRLMMMKDRFVESNPRFCEYLISSAR